LCSQKKKNTEFAALPLGFIPTPALTGYTLYEAKFS